MLLIIIQCIKLNQAPNVAHTSILKGTTHGTRRIKFDTQMHYSM